MGSLVQLANFAKLAPYYTMFRNGMIITIMSKNIEAHSSKHFICVTTISKNFG